MKSFKFIVLALLFSVSISAQNKFSSLPLDPVFVTTDYENFWKAFDKLDSVSGNPFSEYLNNASDGLKPFVDYLNVDSLYQTVLKRKDDYIRSRPVLSGIDGLKKKVQSSYAAMKYWYPKASFPPVYFVVGMYTSGGTASPNGLVIGSEMLENLEGLNGLISHELIHYQQSVGGPNSLLKQTLIEGSADFVGELISGDHINMTAVNYGNKNEEALCKEFVSLMLKDDYQDWLYGTSGKDNRAKNLGYWMGYKICEAYFNKQEDKLQAISDILNISDPLEFTKKSGYLDKFMN